MVKIISLGNNPKLGKDNIFVSLWESFRSLSLFVKLSIIIAILILLSTPFIVGTSQIFGPHALTLSINKVYFSYDLIFDYNVKIKLVDLNNKPVRNIKVVLYPSPLESVTDQNGEVAFTGVSDGRHLVVVKYDNKDLTREIDVKKDSTFGEYTLVVDAPSNNNIELIILYASLAILACLIIGIIIVKL